MSDISKLVLHMDAALSQVLRALNEAASGAVLLVDDRGTMQGILTDGDVRRAILSGASLSDSGATHMNADFVSGSEESSHQDNIALLNDKIRHLPVLNREGQPVDMISWAEIWRLPIMEPSLGGNELKYVSDCVSSNWISSQGEYVTQFEESLADYVGTRHALSTSSGTTALHLSLAAMGIGPGDEVIVPNLTFGASGNVVLHCGARPVFVDVSKETWTLDPDLLEACISERTRAIMPVHIYGHPCDMAPVMETAEAHDLYVIEDCAEALGAKYRSRQVGSIGHVGCFSFFANKVITTGEGGMVTTNDDDLMERMSVLRDHGMRRDRRYWHIYPGYNYRMTNLQAAIGLAQMEQIERFMAHRRQIVERYHKGLASLDGVLLPPAAEWAENIHWLYSIVIDEGTAGLSRDELAEMLSAQGIETRPFFYPMHVQPAYASGGNSNDSFPMTRWLSENGLSLPTANNLDLMQVDRVTSAIREAIENARFFNGSLLEES